MTSSRRDRTDCAGKLLPTGTGTSQYPPIAHNKIPRHVEFVDEFPMTVTGKIQKFMMRDTVEARLGLKTAKDGVRRSGWRVALR